MGASVSLQTLLASLAQLDLASPLGAQDLRGRDASRRIGIEDGIDDVTTAGLKVSMNAS